MIIGSPVPSRLGVPETPGGEFPDTPGTYTSPDGAIIVPGGALDRWFAYRATGAAERREFVAFGDSTTRGAGGEYSWLQRIRDRAVADGLADGGKGIFGGNEAITVYDPPEVNGIASNGFNDSSDLHDVLSGAFLHDDGTPDNASVTFNCRATGFRLWYSVRSTLGEFTYSVDGGPATTVDAYVASGNPTSRFVYVSGLSADTTHTVQVVNTGTGGCRVAFAPVNASGLSVQKHAIDGSTIKNFFFGGAASSPYTQATWGDHYLSALGLNPASIGSPYTGMSVNTTPSEAARVRPVLAAMHLGFNDLTNAVEGDEGLYIEGVKRFAAACSAASCDGIVMSGQLPYNSNWSTFGASRFAAMRDTALAQGLAFVDIFYPVGGPSLSYAGPTTNPHLNRSQYEAQADFLWDELLGV